MWSLFTTHCVKYLEADTVKEAIAAFAPHTPELYSTTDGALQTGNAVIEDSSMPDTRFLIFNVSTTRLDGGVMKNCSLQISGDQVALDSLSTFVQNNAPDLIGDGSVPKGGFVITDKGPEGAALNISTPGFPPEKTVQVLSSKRFSSLSMHSMTAE